MIGTSLGRFQILRELGSGGMGVVYAARDPSLGRDVAIKVLPESALADEVARARLLREARLAATLNHPNVCAVYDVGEAGRRIFIAMELVPGELLSARIGGRPLEPESVLRYGQEIAEALAHAHDRRVIHRDLKSANVMITPEERVKVLDFGVASRAEGGEAPPVAPGSTLTIPGAIVGTPHYSAPEVLRGERADARSDLWGLGIVLYEMASGRLPFSGKTGFELAAAILNEPPAPLPPSVPDGLRAVILRCLEKEPAGRYPRAAEAGAALGALRSAGTARPAGRRLRAPAPAVVAIAAGALLAMLLLAFNAGGLRERLLSGLMAPRVESLAVLPLANLSRDPEQDYFADGMTEMLIATLSQIRALDVISRTSAMHYKGTSRPLHQIARELQVDAALEGAVMSASGRVRLTVKLVLAAGERSLWAQTYERDLKDVLALQSELATAVAREIRIALSEEEKRDLGPRGEVDPAAYELYLRGRYELDRRTPDGLSKAARYFEQVAWRVTGIGEVESMMPPDSAGPIPDPPPAQPPPRPGTAAARTLALGLTGLADVSITLATYGIVRPDLGYERARREATRALEIDGSLAEAHVSLGAVMESYDWDRRGAEREYRRALSLSPNLVDAHRACALFLMREGRMEEALVHLRRALKLDPASARVQSLLGTWYLFSHRYEDAIREFGAARELDPSAVSHYWRGIAYSRNRDHERAIADLEKAVELSGGNPGALAGLACAYALAGRRGDASAFLARLEAAARSGYVAPSAFAFVFSSLGEKDKAFEWLERARDAHDNAMAGLGVEPWLEPLHGDPRFAALLRSVNLSPLPPS